MQRSWGVTSLPRVLQGLEWREEGTEGTGGELLREQGTHMAMGS